MLALVTASCSSFMHPSCSTLPSTSALALAAPPIIMRLQVVTDIDDTIKSSGGIAIGNIPLGGVDTSYQRGAFYPGVFQFAAEISINSLGFGLKKPAPVAILTARAREFRFALEIKQSDKLCKGFRNAGIERGFSSWGVGPVLYGSVAEWICQERKGIRKYENFKLLRAEYASRTKQRYVFVGDNGASEKDLEAAQMIAEEFPDVLAAVFLHAVSPTQQPAPLPEDHSIGSVPVRYFRTYASAASKATQLGLLGGGAARRVLSAVEADMQADKVNIKPGSANEKVLLAELEEARATVNGGTGVLSTLGRPLRRFQRKQ